MEEAQAIPALHATEAGALSASRNWRELLQEGSPAVLVVGRRHLISLSHQSITPVVHWGCCARVAGGSAMRSSNLLPKGIATGMPSTVAAPTIEDFSVVPWRDVLAADSERECWRWCGQFCARAAEADRAGDVRAVAVFTLLARIASLIFKLDAKDYPLSPPDQLDRFTDTELDLLAALLPTVDDPELRARVADILWLRNHGVHHQVGRLAVMAYVTSARRCEDPERWPACADRVERALQIAATLGRGRKNAEYAETITYIEEVLARYDGEDPSFLSAKLMELLQGQRRGDYMKYAALAEKAARRAEAEHAWHRARTYWDVTIRWHELATDTDRCRAAKIAAAETHVQEADDRTAAQRPSFRAAAESLQSAIEAYRRMGGMQQRTEELHKRLLDCQKQGMAEMEVFSASAPIENIEDHFGRARQRVRDKSLVDAVLSLAAVSSPPKRATMERHIREIMGRTPLSNLFATTLVDARGRTKRRIPPSSSDNQGEALIALEATMFPHAARLRASKVMLEIEPAREQINLEHNARVSDFTPIVHDNPFVPPGREGLFARGLHAGLAGDFLVATHLLIPQLDNSLRSLLERRGVLVSGLEDDGSQPERGLNSTLAHPEATAMFGEDMVFDLRGLLVEKAGSNLRHEAMHGLLDEGAFMTTEAAYTWWITLHLCCIPVLNRLWEKRESDDQ